MCGEMSSLLDSIGVHIEVVEGPGRVGADERAVDAVAVWSS